MFKEKYIKTLSIGEINQITWKFWGKAYEKP